MMLSFQFTLVRPDLAAIRDLEGYLFIMLRNMNVSQVRRANLVKTESLSVADYDSAEFGLRVLDSSSQLQAREELRLICVYATLRKERSKVGSVLILRFFHEYYPDEIARFLKSSRHSVEEWLSVARREAKLYIKDPHSLKVVGGLKTVPFARPNTSSQADEFLSELRLMIFESRITDCLTKKQLKDLYRSADGNVSAETLAHLVSCSHCLDEVNKLLDLPLLAERFPTDKSEGGRGPSGGRGGGETGGPSGAKAERLKSLSRRRMKDVLEHRPKELRVAVNGFVLGSQSINAETNRLGLSVNIAEPVGFVEVFSEQGVRLILLNAGSPPDGALEQTARCEFGGGRTLDVNLNFSGPWPTINLAYSDPALPRASEARSQRSEVRGQKSEVRGQRPEVRDQKSEVRGQGASSFFVFSPRSSVFLRVSVVKFLVAARLRCVSVVNVFKIFDLGLFSRPATVTALFALLLIAAVAILYRRTPTPPLSAAGLLQQAVASEEAIAARTDQVLHRTINFEERQVDCPLPIADCRLLSSAPLPSGKLIARRRIEIWQSSEKGITARRLYDERGALVAGDWRRADGVQTIYHHGSRPQLQMRNPQSAIRNFDEAWQVSPSGKEFAALVPQSQQTRLQERADVYVISYESPAAESATQGLIGAELVLSRADLHATEQTLVVRQVNEVRSYHYLETSFERKPVSAVAPAVFEPEPELLGERMKDEGGRMKPDDPSIHPSSFIPHPSVAASADLEVEVLRLLSQAGADLNDQTSVTRTADGRLRIGGLVDTEQRKSEILRALAPVSRNAALEIQIETVDEAVRRQAKARNSSAPITVERAQIAEERIPAYDDLRRYFGKDGSQADQEIAQFATRILSQSRQAMSHAGTMKRLAQRFSEEDLRTMSPEARQKWLSVIRSHARAFEQETRAIRQALQPVFFPSGGGVASSAEIQITDDVSLVRAVERLFQLGAANDDVIRSAFAISTGGTGSFGVKNEAFWRSLTGAEKLAAEIGRR